MSEKVKQSHELQDWSAQSWLFREFQQKMRANNVNRIITITEDNGGNIMTFSHNVFEEGKVNELISSFLEEEVSQ